MHNRSAQEITKNKGVLGQDGFTRVTGFSQTFSDCCVHPLKPHSNPKGPVDQKFREEIKSVTANKTQPCPRDLCKE